MAQVKGKFITLTGQLMSLYPDYLNLADSVIFSKLNKHWNQLDPEGWYDTSLFNLFMNTYAKASPCSDSAIVNVGKHVYPLIKRTAGLPSNLLTPLDYIKYEADGFLANHKGGDVVPRRIIKAVDRDVIIEACAPGYNSILYVGVYLGILTMCGIKTGKVEQTKSQEKGDKVSEFHITW